MVLNLGILINLIYIIYILGFTFRIGIGSGWSSISIQNATMFLMIFFVMRVFMAYYTRKMRPRIEVVLIKLTTKYLVLI